MKTFIYICLAFIILALIILFLYFQNNIIDITKYEIKSEKVKNKMTIAHLSDLHSKPFKNVIKKLYIIEPDIIVITGDYINDKAAKRSEMLEFAKKLLQIAPVYYITGNHERRLEDFDSVMEQLSDVGFRVLLNRVVTDTINENTISILGLDENQADFKDYKDRKKGLFKYKDMSPYFEQLQECDGIKIVLSHFPENFKAVEENNYSKYDFDIQFSGHAHGGQFILPFVGPVFSPGQGLFPKYARGSFGDRPRLIISRGLGNAEFPFRLFNHPEINVVTIDK